MDQTQRPHPVNVGAILVVLPTWVGDFVMATPVLRAVRTHFPAARIVFLMEPNLSELIRGGDWMDECIPWPAKDHRTPLHREYRGLVRELRRSKFDLVLLLPNSFRAAALARLTGARRRVGYDRDGRGWLLTDRVPVQNRSLQRSWADELNPPAFPKNRETAGASPEPVVAGNGSGWSNDKPAAALGGPRIWPGPNVAVRMGRSLPASLGPYWPIPMVEYYAGLAEAIGCPRPDDRLELFVTADCEAALEQRLEREFPQATFHIDAGGQANRLTSGERTTPLVIISPGARFGASKCWLPPRYAEVADRLIEVESATVTITCGPGEESMAREIAGAMRHRAVVLDRPLLSLGEFKSLIRRSSLLICTDSGPRHVAKAFGVPIVTLFGSTHPDWTATSYADERIVRLDVECGPCQQKVCPLGHHQCMTEITSDIVFAAAAELLSQRQTAKAAGPHG